MARAEDAKSMIPIESAANVFILSPILLPPLLFRLRSDCTGSRGFVK